MRAMAARRGPFAQRPYYKPAEMERICRDALQAVGLLPTSPEPIRIDRFIKKHFRVTEDYEDLPPGVLGYTRFGPEGVTAIVVSSALDADTSSAAERRIRTTLAHEAGHGLLHAHLFTLGEKPAGLFEDIAGAKPEIMCRDVAGIAGARLRYDGKWWEYQANRAIGALLMPRGLVYAAAEPFCASSGGLGLPMLLEDRRETAIRELADLFEVNPVVARYRLEEIFSKEKDGQLTL